MARGRDGCGAVDAARPPPAPRRGAARTRSSNAVRTGGSPSSSPPTFPARSSGLSPSTLSAAPRRSCLARATWSSRARPSRRRRTRARSRSATPFPRAVHPAPRGDEGASREAVARFARALGLQSLRGGAAHDRQGRVRRSPSGADARRRGDCSAMRRARRPERRLLASVVHGLGPRWGNVRRVRRGRGEALLSLDLPGVRGRSHAVPAAPGAARRRRRRAGAPPGLRSREPFLRAFSYGRVLLRGGLPARLHSHVRLREGSARSRRLRRDAARRQRPRVAEITDFVMRRVAAAAR